MNQKIHIRSQIVAPFSSQRPDYGVDAPAVMRSIFLCGALSLLIAIFAPPVIRLGHVTLAARSFYWTGGCLIGEGMLFLLYVKVGKFRHRDFMLDLHSWRGDEQVLDIGCGRGLLLAGAARRIAAVGGTGHATGLDVWSNVDMGGNSAAATQHNLDIEGLSSRCTLVSKPAQEMPFDDETFDVIVSNLCIHNIYDAKSRTKALDQIVRVLKPGGVALISDYKRTGEYARRFRKSGLIVKTVVIARKPM